MDSHLLLNSLVGPATLSPDLGLGLALAHVFHWSESTVIISGSNSTSRLSSLIRGPKISTIKLFDDHKCFRR